MGMRDIERDVRNIRKALADKLECDELIFEPCNWPEHREKFVELIESLKGKLEQLEKLEERVSALEVLLNG